MLTPLLNRDTHGRGQTFGSLHPLQGDLIFLGIHPKDLGRPGRVGNLFESISAVPRRGVNYERTMR